jgi:predicted acetyltransferase
MPNTLELRRPRLDDEAEVMRAGQATTPEVPHFLHHYQEGMTFRRYLEVLDEQERGVDLPPGWVPSTFLFAFVEERIVGRVSIRHHLTDALTHVGGHVGYAVVPEFRRRGYATVMLRLALDIAHDQLGIDRVMISCDDDNVGSIRTIERNGGVLENVVTDPGSATPTRRYWIDTRARDQSRRYV